MRTRANFHRFFWVALFLHMMVLTIFIVNFEWNSKRPVVENADKDNEVINAVVLNQSRVQVPHPVTKIQNKPKQNRPVIPVVPPKRLVEAPAKIQKQVMMLPKKTQIKPLPTLKKTQTKPLPTPTKVPIKPLPILKKTQVKPLPKDLIEKQLLADLKKQTDKQKKMKQKNIEEAFAKEMKTQAANQLQQQLLQEANRLASAQPLKMRGIVDKYKALILQSIEQYWLVPNGVNKSLSSELLIRLAPGGVVLDVQLVKSSGDDALDRSARMAVLKASPLPVPSTSAEFQSFRQFVLKVKPENVLSRDGGLS